MYTDDPIETQEKQTAYRQIYTQVAPARSDLDCPLCKCTLWLNSACGVYLCANTRCQYIEYKVM